MSTIRFLILGFLVILLSSCGPRIVGHAVIIWPDPERTHLAGDILPVVQTSQLQGTVTALVNNAEQSIPAWRVNFFEAEAAAQAFAEGFAPWRESYARSLITALPVRARPDRTSTRLYRLRDGEVVKVFGRTDEQSNEAGLVDYWYQVLTEDGTQGWAFGRNLELVSATGRALEPRDDQDRMDRLVRDIAAIAWRPSSFEDMRRSGRINLDRFNPRYGFFGDAEENTFELVLPGLERTFRYIGYSMPRSDTIQFEGTALTLIRHSDERLEVQYLLDDRQRSSNFIVFDHDIQGIIQQERNRRQDRLQTILLRGNVLVSTAFGTMRLDSRGAVTWEGYERLVPAVVPAAFPGNATMQFSLFIADDLRGRYDGAFRLAYPGGPGIAFLYTITDDGVRLVFVPERQISDQLLIREEPVSPVVLFFRFDTE